MLFRAAELELLIAECANYQNKEQEWLVSFKRATEMFLGIKVVPVYFLKQEYLCEDAHTALIKLNPYLVKMLIWMSSNKSEPIKIAAVKGIEYLLETLGCTLDNYMIDILKTLIF